MSLPRLEIIQRQPAHDLLKDSRFLAQWKTLCGKCPHATAFQSAAFAGCWYEAYRAAWNPVIVRWQDSNGELTGLWLLAHNPRTKELAHAGSHQSEYHAWLALPGEDIPFLSAAWAELTQRFSFSKLNFKYLPSVALGETLPKVSGMHGRVVIRKHARPLLKLDSVDISESFAKKSNKSRFNRLGKLGKVEFRRITDTLELERVFDDLIAHYDARQSAVNQSSPFRDDPMKRAFHTSLFKADPAGTCLTATFLDNRLIAAFWGTVSGKVVHLGMLVHSPSLAEHSPGKLHIMQLSEYLLSEGLEMIDLTPGGDPWKERFANAHDEVAEAVVYRHARDRFFSSVYSETRKRAKKLLGIFRA